MTQKSPVAFMSYVHLDDKYGHLTTLKERLSDEVQVQTGIQFSIFQDRKDIRWGQNWRERIENSLDETTFLIPIITPSFFKSKACREELTLFIEREKNLGRTNLILPIYFVDTPLLNDAELRATDELAQVIASRQYADWRDLRFEPFTNPLVGKMLAHLAVQIRDAMPPVKTTRKAPDRAALFKPPADTGEAGEQLAQSPTPKRDPPIRIVDPMHRGDFATISDAIKAVEPGTRILVLPGLYEEAIVIDKPLEIIGEGELSEIVLQVGGTNLIRFQTTMGRIVNLTLRQIGGGNFYCVNIAQGRLELEDCDITSQGASCVGIHGGADPRLRRNRIHDGQSSGVFVYQGGQGTLEDNDIFGNAISGVAIAKGGNPTLRRNRIHDSKQGGVHVYDGGQGAFEDNDIFNNTYAGVQIGRGGTPTLRRNRIHDGKQGGVHVYDGGLGIIEDNEIFNNVSGLISRSGAQPVAKKNRINKNRNYGIRVYENGGGKFEDNDLTGNAKGAWSISEDSKANVKRSNNKE